MLKEVKYQHVLFCRSLFIILSEADMGDRTKRREIQIEKFPWHAAYDLVPVQDRRGGGVRHFSSRLPYESDWFCDTVAPCTDGVVKAGSTT